MVENQAQIKHRVGPSFWRLRKPPGPVFGAILGVILGAFLAPTAGSRNLWKTLIFDDSTALFAVFSGPRGSKIEEKWVRKQHPAGTGLQERLGRLQGAILEPFGGHLGPQNRSGRGSENYLNFACVSRGPQGGRVSRTQAPLGSRTARGGPLGRGRGGVCNIRRGLY